MIVQTIIAEAENHVAPNLQQEIGKQRPFDAPEQEAYLNAQRTAAVLGAQFERLFRAHGLSDATYNVLRILRGGGDEGWLCHEIAQRLVAPRPDVTRLLDRLERQGLIRRRRGSIDRREVRVTLKPAALRLLGELDGPVLDLHRRQLGRMSRGDLGTLNRLLVLARQPQTDP